jgi:hypothetical protein
MAMTGVHGRETEAMLEAYDFTGIKTLADIGGGNGSVITAILKRFPEMQGIFFVGVSVPPEAAQPRTEPVFLLRSWVWRSFRSATCSLIYLLGKSTG